MTEVVQGRTASLTATFSLGDGTPVDLTGATITITPVAGGAAVVGPTSTGVTHPGTGTYGYSWVTAAALPAVDYLAVWSGAYGASTVTAQEVVTVLAAPVAGAYASVADLTSHLGSTPVNAAQLLVRASRDVDKALLCAVYDATDQDVIDALQEATLEQVVGNLGVGNTTGLGASTGGFTLGRLSVQAKTSGGEGSPQRIGVLWEQAWNVLQAAGLTGYGPQTW